MWIKPVYQQNATLPRVKTSGDRPMTMSIHNRDRSLFVLGYIIFKRMCGPRHSAASDLELRVRVNIVAVEFLAVDGLDRVLAGKGEAFGWITTIDSPTFGWKFIEGEGGGEKKKKNYGPEGYLLGVFF